MNCKNCNSSDICLECRDPTYIIDNGKCVPSPTPFITPFNTPFLTSLETPYTTPMTTFEPTVVQTPYITPAETSEPSDPTESDSVTPSNSDKPDFNPNTPNPNSNIEKTYRYEDIQYIRSKLLTVNGRLYHF